MRSSTSIAIVSGPGFICQMLAQHRKGGFMTARGYRATKGSMAILVHHSDHASQCAAIAYDDRLHDVGFDKSTGSVGDSYNNALAKSVNALYKAELVYSQTRENLAEVEWVTRPLVEHHPPAIRLNYHTPQEIDNHYWHTHSANIYNNELVTA